jgi:putative transposase
LHAAEEQPPGEHRWSRNRSIDVVEIPPEERVVHLKGYGFVKVFRTVSQDGNAKYWATNDLQIAEATWNDWKTEAGGIEVYHRGIKQCCGIEQAQVRTAAEQKSHLLMAL